MSIEQLDISIKIQCFGNFEVCCDGKPIIFKYSQTKEFLAYLVDRNGVTGTMAEIEDIIFEDSEHHSYFNQMHLDFLNTLDKLGMENIINKNHGSLSICRSKVQCDYLDNKEKSNIFEYMSQYSFG